jgi:hypothetical protein
VRDFEGNESGVGKDFRDRKKKGKTNKPDRQLLEEKFS